MNPFNLDGPQFLIFFICSFVVAAIGAHALARMFRGGQDRSPDEELAPLSLAYLSGSERTTVLAANATLIRNGNITLGRRGSVTELAPVPDDAHPVVRACHDALTTGGSPLLLRMPGQIKKAHAELDELARPLRDRGLLVDTQQKRMVRVAQIVPLGFVIILGTLRTAFGIQADKPVAFLVLLLIASIIYSLVYLYRARPLRTTAGDRLLADEQNGHRALRVTAKRKADNLTGAETATAVGLFGVGALASSTIGLETLAVTRATQAGTGTTAACGGSSCGSSCGGGGCGGGCGG